MLDTLSTIWNLIAVLFEVGFRVTWPVMVIGFPICVAIIIIEHISRRHR